MTRISILGAIRKDSTAGGATAPVKVFGLALVLLSLTVVSRSVLAEDEDWMPQARHLEAADQGRECAIYRSIATKARLTLEQAQDAELHLTELLKVRRAELVQCASLREVDMDGSDEAEEIAAEICPAAYDQWVRTGVRLQASRQDREGTEHSISSLSGQLERFCQSPTALRPTALQVR